MTVLCILCMFFFFFKQKTAYEMRISDWSSDVCSSDLFFAALRTGSLVAVEGQPSLSEGDISRIAAARRIVDTRWHEKLTIDNIARSCGINRDKLTRGFRELYHCSVGEALSERRDRKSTRLNSSH